MKIVMSLAAILLAAAVAAPLRAQSASEELGAIQDNSFLVEEAYNQEAGVIQHISVFTRDNESGDWEYNFTQEIPVTSQKHQFSYSIPVVRTEGTGLGDVMLNYRYQLVGTGETDLAISPRVSLVLPTGDDEKGRGTGSFGIETNLPVSWVLTPKIVAHSNAGFRLTNDDRLLDVTLGQSFIYALKSRLHLMLESSWSRSEVSDGEHETGFVVNPGIRWAYNRPSGLQIVPGISVPIGVGPSSGSDGVLFYISFEHPMH